jgi:hypothetical protein
MHLKYRLTPCDAGITDDLLAMRFPQFEKQMQRYLDAGATLIYLGSIPRLLKEHSGDLPQIEAFLKSRGWTSHFYVRPGFDEASSDLVPQIRAVCQQWKQVSAIPIMETYYHEEPEGLYGMLDIWSRSVSDAPWIRRRMEAGDRFWKVNAFPNALEPEPWIIRRTYIRFWDFRFTGTYIWTVKQWTGVTKWYEDFWCDAGVGNLAAVLMWPHETGILSTIRLEALRDAIEDNAVLWMLREKLEAWDGREPADAVTAAALGRARDLCSGSPLSDRIDSVASLQALRLQAGETLSALNDADPAQ